MVYTRQLATLDFADRPLAGGKGASLGGFLRLKVRVPDGFVILASAFDAVFHAVVTAHGLAGPAAARLRSPCPLWPVDQIDAVQQCAQQIRALLLDAPVPPAIADELLDVFRALDAPFVAVRSSATCEDGEQASWAGMLDTFLNTTEATLLDRVRRCWASLFSPRAVAYHLALGQARAHVADALDAGSDDDQGPRSVAVVVQRMVDSEVAGVASSIHPLTRRPHQPVVTAAYGLGAAIVSADVTPDRYVVDMRTKTVIERQVGVQERELVRAADGSVQWQHVRPPRATRQKLSDGGILALARTAEQVERHLGRPVEIEWARARDTLYVLQARPLTGLHDPHPPVVSPEAVVDGPATSNDLPVRVRDWELFGTRPFTLWVSSLIAAFLDSPRIQRVFGHGLPDALFVQSGAQRVRHYRVREQMRMHRAAVAHLVREQPDECARLLTAGLMLNERAERILSGGTAAHTPLEQTLDFVCDVFLHGTVLPYEALAVLEAAPAGGLAPDAAEGSGRAQHTQHTPHTRLQELAERLRRVSYYPPLIEQFVHPLAVARLSATGAAVQPNDLALVTVAELRAGELHALAARRELSAAGKQFIYQRLGGVESVGWVDDTRALVARLEGRGAGSPAAPAPTELHGEVAYPGNVVGTVRLALTYDSTSVAFEEGDILVSINGSPRLLPLMRLAGGLITDEGGINCHVASLARELKKPCIMGTRQATTTLRDGMRIVLDADAGVIRVLDDPPVDGSR